MGSDTPSAYDVAPELLVLLAAVAEGVGASGVLRGWWSELVKGLGQEVAGDHDQSDLVTKGFHAEPLRFRVKDTRDGQPRGPFAVGQSDRRR